MVLRIESNFFLAGGELDGRCLVDLMVGLEEIPQVEASPCIAFMADAGHKDIFQGS